MSDNLRASLLMIFAMLAFAVGDAFFKYLSVSIPPGQLILMSTGLGTSVLMIWGIAKGKTIAHRNLLSGKVFVRNFAEVFCGLLGILALLSNDLSLHTAVSQAIPIVVTVAAALYLREVISPLKVAMTLAGFAGVLMVVEPWSVSFKPAVWLSVGSVFAVALRDVVTRRIPKEVSSYALLFWSHMTSIPVALFLLWYRGESFVAIEPIVLILSILPVLFGLLGGVALTLSVRLGEASATTPFRYSRILFAFVLGVVVFKEEITTGMLLGSAVLVAAGLVLLRSDYRRARRMVSGVPALGQVGIPASRSPEERERAKS